MDEVCNISNKYQLPSNIPKQYLLKRHYLPHSFGKKLALSITNDFQNIHFFRHFHYFRSPLQNLLGKSAFYQFLLVFTEDEVCNILNKNQLSRNLVKYQYFYTRDFIFLLHYEIKLSLSIAKRF